MPYIKNLRRECFDPSIEHLASNIITEGELCYCIYKLLVDYSKKYKSCGLFNFNIISHCMTAIECAKLEFYRRIVTPYEEIKIKENGDID